MRAHRVAAESRAAIAVVAPVEIHPMALAIEPVERRAIFGVIERVERFR